MCVSFCRHSWDFVSPFNLWTQVFYLLLVTGSVPWAPLSASAAHSVLELELPGSVLQVFFLFPHELFPLIFLL